MFFSFWTRLTKIIFKIFIDKEVEKNWNCHQKREEFNYWFGKFVQICFNSRWTIFVDISNRGATWGGGGWLGWPVTSFGGLRWPKNHKETVCGFGLIFFKIFKIVFMAIKSFFIMGLIFNSKANYHIDGISDTFHVL